MKKTAVSTECEDESMDNPNPVVLIPQTTIIFTFISGLPRISSPSTSAHPTLLVMTTSHSCSHYGCWCFIMPHCREKSNDRRTVWTRAWHKLLQDSFTWVTRLWRLNPSTSVTSNNWWISLTWILEHCSRKSTCRFKHVQHKQSFIPFFHQSIFVLMHWL